LVKRNQPGLHAQLALSTCAALLGRDELGSTTDLVLGDAGRLLAMLRGFASRAELGRRGEFWQRAPGQRAPARGAVQ
jgi:hypothetical protein